MTEHGFAAALFALLQDNVDIDDSFDGNGVHPTVPYDEINNSACVVVRLQNGSEFHTTVVRIRGPRS